MRCLVGNTAVKGRPGFRVSACPSPSQELRAPASEAAPVRRLVGSFRCQRRAKVSLVRRLVGAFAAKAGPVAEVGGCQGCASPSRSPRWRRCVA